MNCSISFIGYTYKYTYFPTLCFPLNMRFEKSTDAGGGGGGGGGGGVCREKIKTKRTKQKQMLKYIYI